MRSIQRVQFPGNRCGVPQCLLKEVANDCGASIQLLPEAALARQPERQLDVCFGSEMKNGIQNLAGSAPGLGRIKRCLVQYGPLDDDFGCAQATHIVEEYAPA